MKLLASSAALFVWLQFALCGFAAHGSAPQHSHSQEAGHSRTHAHADQAEAQVPVPHPHDDQHGDSGGGEDHCDLTARTLVSATPSVDAHSWITLPACLSAPFAGERFAALSAACGRLREPPNPPDLVIRNASFLL